MVDLTSTPSNGLTLKSVGFFWAVYGTAIPATTATLPVDWKYFGATDKDTAVNFTPPGSPTRNVVQAAIDGGVDFAVGYEASTDAATLSMSALEITQANLDLLLHLQRTAGSARAAHKGGVPDHIAVLAIGQTEDGTEIGVGLPYCLPSIDGAVALSVSGTDATVKLPATFSGDMDPVAGEKYVVIGGSDGVAGGDDPED